MSGRDRCAARLSGPRIARDAAASAQWPPSASRPAHRGRARPDAARRPVDELVGLSTRRSPELAQLAGGLGMLREITPRTTLPRGAGRTTLAQLFAAALEASGCPAATWTRRSVQTDAPSQRLRGPGRTVRSGRRARSAVLARGAVPSCLASRAAPDGEVATLGRGGSDLTRPAGACFGSREYRCEGRPGLLTADPRIVPDARVCRRSTYAKRRSWRIRAKVLQSARRSAGDQANVAIRIAVRRSRVARTEISRAAHSSSIRQSALGDSEQALLPHGSGMLGVPGMRPHLRAVHHEGSRYAHHAGFVRALDLLQRPGGARSARRS